MMVIFFYMLGVTALLVLSRALVASWKTRIILIWLIALNPLWIACFVEGYVDGPAIAFCLLSFAALAASRVRLLGLPRECWGGAAVALALSTQPLAGGIAGLVLLIVAIISERAWRGTFLFVGWAALGGICVLLALGTIGTFFNLPFLYLIASDEWIGRFFTGATQDVFVAPIRWLPSATRVALWPFALLLLAMVVRRDRLRGISRAEALITAIAIWTVLFFIANLCARGFFTQFRFYSSYIFISIVPLLAVMLERHKIRESCESRWWMALVVLVLGVVAPAVASEFAISNIVQAPRLPTIWAMLAVLGLASAAAYWLNKRNIGFIAIALFLTLTASTNGDTSGTFATAGKPDRQARFAAIAEVQRAVAESGLADKRILFWFNRNDFSQSSSEERQSTYSFYFSGKNIQLNMLDSIGSTFGLDRSSLGYSMPKLDEIWYRQLYDLYRISSYIILLCARSGDCQQGVQVLASQGILLRQKLIRSVAFSEVPPFTMLIVEVAPDLRVKFPCDAERERAGYLFDHLKSLQTEENLRALQSLFGQKVAELGECFSRFKTVSEVINFERVLLEFPTMAACERDSKLAELYFTDVFDVSLRSQTAPLLLRASEAYRGQHAEDCLVAAGQIRKAYFDRVQQEVAEAIQPLR